MNETLFNIITLSYVVFSSANTWIIKILLENASDYIAMYSDVAVVTRYFIMEALSASDTGYIKRNTLNNFLF